MISELAEKVSEVPKLYEEGNKSTGCLLKDFGFPESRKDISVDEVEAVLKNVPAWPISGLSVVTISVWRAAGASSTKRIIGASGISPITGIWKSRTVSAPARNSWCGMSALSAKFRLAPDGRNHQSRMGKLTCTRVPRPGELSMSKSADNWRAKASINLLPSPRRNFAASMPMPSSLKVSTQLLRPAAI